MKLKQITFFLEEYAPLLLQESYDNVGLILGDPEQEIHQALISLDITEDVLEEAITRQCNLIISHHPLIFRSICKITRKTSVERMIIKAIKNDLAIYAIHTNIDNLLHGVNKSVSEKFRLKNLRILSPRKDLLHKLVTFCPLEKSNEVREALFQSGAGYLGNYDKCSFNLEGRGSFRALENADPYVGNIGELHFENEVRIEMVYPVYREKEILEALLQTHPYEEVAYDIYSLGNEFNNAGAGVIGELPERMDEKKFLEKVKQEMKCSCIRHSGLTGGKVIRVAICGGSGSFLIQKAIAAKADAFITADLKYHNFFEAEGKILLADIGHYESEQFVKELLFTIISEKFPNFACFISELNTNSVNYF
jgi:dinuclear metal center YbgI/SA1388 family protein